jgi:VWFA-related protein
MNRMPWVGTVAIGLVVAALAVLGAAGQAPQQPPPRFQTGVDLVRLDVSVLDSDRNPVRGLTAADFTILEDGKPQGVATFKAIDLPDVVAPRPGDAPWLREAASDVRGNTDFKDKRVVAIVMDDASPVATREVLYFSRWARQLIAGLAPEDLAAVVFTQNKGAGQDFTTDRSRLLAAVDRFNASLAMPTMTRDGAVRPAAWNTFDSSLATNYSASVNTLRRLSEYLADLPDRRKALAFVSVGIPIDISVAGPVEARGGSADVSGVAQNLITDLSETLRAAQRANVNIYAFDPGGLRAPFGGDGAADLGSPDWLSRTFLKTLSDGTGGFAVVDYNDPGPGITQMVRENGSYYLLGYVPANPRAQGRFRKVEVRVNRPDVLVRARTGYLEPHPARIVKASAKVSSKPSSLTEASAGIVPKADLPLEIAATPFQMPGRREAAVGLLTGVRAYAPMRATRAVIQVDMAAAAYSPDGKRRASKRQTVPVNLNFPGFGKTIAFELLSRLDLPPGRYQIRLAAETSVHGVRAADLSPEVALIAPGEDTGSKSGSVYCDVDVPDFQNDPLGLSGIALTVTPHTVSGPAGALAAVVPVVPTTLRDFFRTDLIGGFVRVSQGGKQPLQPVTLSVRVVDDRGVFVHDQSGPLDPARFAASRMADEQFEVPVSKLAPGRYLLTVAATAGTRTVHREARFTVLR